MQFQSKKCLIGNFPTVSYPNPEDPKAFELALKLAKEKDADIVLATDPDADRLGVYAKDPNTNEYVSFTGNMSALLIAEYILSEKKKRNSIPENRCISYNNSIIKLSTSNSQRIWNKVN